MKAFSIREALSFGWQTFKKDPWFFIGVFAALLIGTMVINNVLTSIMPLLGVLVSFAVSAFVSIASTRLALSVQSGPHIGWRELWAPQYFWNMLGAVLLTGIIVCVGFILLIIPGIILSLMLIFTQYAVVDKGLGPIMALKESYRLTKGHLWRIFLFVLAMILLNFVGLIALVVGLLVTVPVTLFATAYVYKKLANAQEPMVVNEAPSLQ